jgi:hypothetical protein
VPAGVVEQIANRLGRGVGVEEHPMRDAGLNDQAALGDRQLAGSFDFVPEKLTEVDGLGRSGSP